MKKLILAATLALIPLRGMAVTTTKTFAKQAVATSVPAAGVDAGALNLATTIKASGNVNVGTGVQMSTIAAAGSISTPGAMSAGTVNIAGSGQLLTGNASSTSLATLVPGQAKGALITNSTTGELCTSTATVAGSWVLVRALATACY